MWDQGEQVEELKEEVASLRRQVKEYEDDYDLLGRCVVALAAIPAGTPTPSLGIHPGTAYVQLLVGKICTNREAIEKFIEFGWQFVPKKEPDGACE